MQAAARLPSDAVPWSVRSISHKTSWLKLKVLNRVYFKVELQAALFCFRPVYFCLNRSGGTEFFSRQNNRTHLKLCYDHVTVRVTLEFVTHRNCEAARGRCLAEVLLSNSTNMVWCYIVMGEELVEMFFIVAKIYFMLLFHVISSFH